LPLPYPCLVTVILHAVRLTVPHCSSLSEEAGDLVHLKASSGFVVELKHRRLSKRRTVCVFLRVAVPVALRRFVAKCSANGADHCDCQCLGSDGILLTKRSIVAGPLSNARATP
jgi:hypothetical protein